MRLIYNILALLLATIVLAAPISSTSNDALTDSVSASEHASSHHHRLHKLKLSKHADHHEESEVVARSFDELEERSFDDEEYTQLERRNKRVPFGSMDHSPHSASLPSSYSSQSQKRDLKSTGRAIKSAVKAPIKYVKEKFNTWFRGNAGNPNKVTPYMATLTPARPRSQHSDRADHGH